MNGKILEHPTLSKKKQCAGLMNALEITEQMLVLARSGHWSEVGKLELKRRGFLDDCLSKPVARPDVELFSNALQALLNLNDSLMVCVQDTRNEFEQQRCQDIKALTLADNYLDIKKIR